MSYTYDQLKEAVDVVLGQFDFGKNGYLYANEALTVINTAFQHMKVNRQVTAKEVDDLYAAAY
jgi:hypothetical protein